MYKNKRKPGNNQEKKISIVKLGESERVLPTITLQYLHSRFLDV